MATRRSATDGDRIWAVGVLLARLVLSLITGFIAWVAATLVFQEFIMNPPPCPIGEGPPGCTYDEPAWSIWGAVLSGLLIAGGVFALTRRWQRFSPY